MDEQKEEMIRKKYGVMDEPQLTEEDDFIDGEEVNWWELLKS